MYMCMNTKYTIYQIYYYFSKSIIVQAILKQYYYTQAILYSILNSNMASNLAEETILAVLPKITAGLSVCCSGIIVTLVLRDPHRRSKVFHRLILGMSLTDFITSFWWVMSSWPIPKEAEDILWASGTTRTCTVQGFFLQIGIANPLYNLSLSVYYLAAIHWSWGEEKLRKIEPYFHLGPLGWGIGTAIAGIPLQIFNNANLWCWIADHPGRNEHTAPYRWGIFYVPLWLAAILVSVNLAKVVTYFQKVTKGCEDHVNRNPSIYVSESEQVMDLMDNRDSNMDSDIDMDVDMDMDNRDIEMNNYANIDRQSHRQVHSHAMANANVDIPLPISVPTPVSVPNPASVPVVTLKPCRSISSISHYSGTVGNHNDSNNNNSYAEETERSIGAALEGTTSSNDDIDVDAGIEADASIDVDTNFVVDRNSDSSRNRNNQKGKTQTQTNTQTHTQMQMQNTMQTTRNTSNNDELRNSTFHTRSAASFTTTSNTRHNPARFATRRRRLAFQCLRYALVFYATWFPITLLRILQTSNKSIGFPILFLAALLTPLQGLPNILVYLYPLFTKMIQQRKKQQQNRAAAALALERFHQNQYLYHNPYPNNNNNNNNNNGGRFIGIPLLHNYNSFSLSQSQNQHMQSRTRTRTHTLPPIVEHDFYNDIYDQEEGDISSSSEESPPPFRVATFFRLSNNILSSASRTTHSRRTISSLGVSEAEETLASSPEKRWDERQHQHNQMQKQKQQGDGHATDSHDSAKTNTTKLEEPAKEQSPESKLQSQPQRKSPFEVDAAPPRPIRIQSDSLPLGEEDKTETETDDNNNNSNNDNNDNDIDVEADRAKKSMEMDMEIIIDDNAETDVETPPTRPRQSVQAFLRQQQHRYGDSPPTPPMRFESESEQNGTFVSSAVSVAASVGAASVCRSIASGTWHSPNKDTSNDSGSGNGSGNGKVNAETVVSRYKSKALSLFRKECEPPMLPARIESESHDEGEELDA